MSVLDHPVISHDEVLRVARAVPAIRPVVPADPEELLALAFIEGRPVAEVEAALRPFGDAGSMEGFIGPEGMDDLRVCLARDCAMLQALGLTADQVTRPGRVLTRLQELKMLGGGALVELHPGRFTRVTALGWIQSQSSPMDGDVFPAGDVTIEDVATGFELENVNRLVFEMGARWLFFEGAATPWRVSPEDLALAFGLRTREQVDRARREVDPRFEFRRYAAMYHEERFGDVAPYRSDPSEPPLPVIERTHAEPDTTEATRLALLGMTPIPGTLMLEHADFLVDCSAGTRTYHDIVGYYRDYDYSIAAIRVHHNYLRGSAHDVCFQLLTRSEVDGRWFESLAQLDGMQSIDSGTDPEHTKSHRELPHLAELPMAEQLRMGGFAPHARVAGREFHRLTTPRGEFIAEIRRGMLTRLYGSVDTPGQVHPIIAGGRITAAVRGRLSHPRDNRADGLSFENGAFLMNTADEYPCDPALIRDATPAERVWLIRRDWRMAGRLGFGWYKLGEIPAGDPLLASMPASGAPQRVAAPPAERRL